MSSTDVLLNIATAARLFHASDGTGFADLIIDGHRETWPLRGKRMLPQVRLQRLPRMADFALWATACESPFRPRAPLKPLLVREIMADRAQWTGSRIRPFAGRRQPVWLAKEPARAGRPVAPGTALPPHTRN